VKENSIKNERSSIEEDIILLKDFIEGNFKRDKLENYKGSYKMGYFYYKDIQQALEHILSDYKRVLKENEKYKKAIDVVNKEKADWIRAYQEEKDKQFGFINKMSSKNLILKQEIKK
jgi:hypothetical protein